jgi:hypothetical protein
VNLTRPRQPHIDQLDIDESANGMSPLRQTNAEGAHGYIWNSTTQGWIPILPEDHPDHRQNAETIAAAIRRWNGERPKNKTEIDP